MKIKRETLNDKVEQTLRKMLLEGRWLPGERLPPETELAELFGVSRLTLHMALQKLSVQGLVNIRAGDGTFAKQFSLRSYLDAASDLYVTPEMLDDVYDFRRLVEIECVRLACARAETQDFQDIQVACDRYLQVIRDTKRVDEDSVRQYVKADLDFHYNLCRASHNSMYVLSFCAAQGALAQYLTKIVTSRIENRPDLSFTRSGVELHQFLLDTLRKRDFETCREAYEAHIDHRMDLQTYEAALQRIEEKCNCRFTPTGVTGDTN